MASIRQKRKGKLAYKLLIWFLLVSLGPLLFTGYHLVHVTKRSLREESIRIQQSQAIGFGETVSNYVSQFKSMLVSAAQQPDFASMDPARQQAFLTRLMQLHAAFLEISVIDANGKERIRRGRFLTDQPEMRNFADKFVFLRPMKEGVEYVGGLERFLGTYPALIVSVPIIELPSREINGVLVAKLGLNGLSHMLHQQFPDAGPAQGAVIAPDPPGFLIAHSNQDRVFTPDARLPDPILSVILTQNKPIGGGEIPLPSGERLLGAYAEVKDLKWIVYVQQPLETAYKTAEQMEEQIFSVLIYVVVATTLLGFLVASLITRPLQSLKAAAQRLAEGEFEEVPDVASSDDEIGELAQTFQAMSASLKEKTQELMGAKEELERLNRNLENRVEARTRELKAAQDELIKKERLAAIGQMASVVGHEIRNPLAVINNSIYFVKTKLGAGGAEIDPKIAKHVSIIESEIQQANGIISEILTFARQRELKPEVKSINLFLEDILSTYPFPGSTQILKEFCVEDPSVKIDPEEMKQAMRNLVGNAIEAMGGAGLLKISTSVVSNQDWVRIDVVDTGGGIPKDVLERIFTPFFTTKSRGTGLGLAVVKKVIDHHKGKVEVDSVPGKGTTFKLYLPLASRMSPTSGLMAGN